MHVNITAGGVQAVCAVLGVIWVATLFVINAIVDRKLRRFMIDLNGTYIRAYGSKVTGHEIEGRMSAMEEVVFTKTKKAKA